MGWQDLEDIKQQLTPAEIRFEEARRSIGVGLGLGLGLGLGPLSFLVLAFLLPPLPGVTSLGMRTLGDFYLGGDLVDH